MRWHLLIDYDSNMQRLENSTLAARLERSGYKIAYISRQPSPSGKGEHVRIQLDREPSSPMEIVALQAACGSDPLRESANILRARHLRLVPEWWRSRWNVLYGTRGNNGEHVHRFTKRDARPRSTRTGRSSGSQDTGTGVRPPQSGNR